MSCRDEDRGSNEEACSNQMAFLRSIRAKPAEKSNAIIGVFIDVLVDHSLVWLMHNGMIYIYS